MVINKVCKIDSNCIDVGCHKGEVLDLFIKKSTSGYHWGFEPIPILYSELCKKYNSNKKIKVKQIALSNNSGETTFNYVVSNPSYSGIKKRKYDRKYEIDEQITVVCKKMDNIIPNSCKIDIIKIDVEGGELLVLEGAIETIRKNKPYIIFEHGLGASEFYESNPEKIFKLLNSCGLKISTMKNWLNKKPCFTIDDFSKQFYDRINYYFIAYP